MKKYARKSIDNDFLEILSRYQGIIHKVNLVYFKTAEDRKDNFQEVVYQLWKSFPSLKDKSKIGSWIYAVAINVSISVIRKESNHVFTELIPEIVHTNEIDKMEQDMDFRVLLEAIQRLNDIDKSIMLLYLEEYSYEQIAEITGISRSNVGVRINRAKKQLKTILNGISEYGK
jgi:RNA polymerase sigma-70 factor (ECF subfamily)